MLAPHGSGAESASGRIRAAVRAAGPLGACRLRTGRSAQPRGGRGRLPFAASRPLERSAPGRAGAMSAERAPAPRRCARSASGRRRTRGALSISTEARTAPHPVADPGAPAAGDPRGAEAGACTPGTVAHAREGRAHRERHRRAEWRRLLLGRRPGDTAQLGAKARQVAAATRRGRSWPGDRPTRWCSLARSTGWRLTAAHRPEPWCSTRPGRLRRRRARRPREPAHAEQKMADCLMDLVSVPVRRPGSVQVLYDRGVAGHVAGATSRARSTAMSCRPRRSVRCSPCSVRSPVGRVPTSPEPALDDVASGRAIAAGLSGPHGWSRTPGAPVGETER